MSLLFFFFNDTATTEIYTLSLHDALPISSRLRFGRVIGERCDRRMGQDRIEPLFTIIRAVEEVREQATDLVDPHKRTRSEEHTSELQSPDHLVCRLLLEKKKIHRSTRSTK